MGALGGPSPSEVEAEMVQKYRVPGVKEVTTRVMSEVVSTRLELQVRV